MPSSNAYCPCRCGCIHWFSKTARFTGQQTQTLCLSRQARKDLHAASLQLLISLSLGMRLAVSRPCTATVQGLAAILVQGLGGCKPQQIVQVPPNFIEKLCPQQSLTPSRSNGFLNMFCTMQHKSFEVMRAQEQVRWQHPLLTHFARSPQLTEIGVWGLSYSAGLVQCVKVQQQRRGSLRCNSP